MGQNLITVKSFFAETEHDPHVLTCSHGSEKVSGDDKATYQQETKK
jgi:hypothetical protein